jgi:hypothetical protein
MQFTVYTDRKTFGKENFDKADCEGRWPNPRNGAAAERQSENETDKRTKAWV